MGKKEVRSWCFKNADFYKIQKILLKIFSSNMVVKILRCSGVTLYKVLNKNN